MRRIQTALMFWALAAVSTFAALVRVNAADLSLVSYDDHGVQQTEHAPQSQPCQSCERGENCASNHCAGEECACPSQNEMSAAAASPMILNIGPPPRLYSPSSDFGTRIEGSSICCVVGDESCATAQEHPSEAPAQQHPPVTMSPACPVGTAYSVPPMPMAFGNYGPMPAPAYMAPCVGPMPSAAYMTPTGFPVIGSEAMLQSPHYAVYTACDCANGVCAGDKLDHMLQAVQHLEAAGMRAEADRLRCECDAQMRDVVNQLKAAEEELAWRRKSATATAGTKANHPQSPVVIAAATTGPKNVKHAYAVQQAGYISPSESFGQPDRSFNQQPLPAPFVAQSIIIEPIKEFGETGERWQITPATDTTEIVPLEASRPDYLPPWWNSFRE